jgi:hypothetical protein
MLVDVDWSLCQNTYSLELHQVLVNSTGRILLSRVLGSANRNGQYEGSKRELHLGDVYGEGLSKIELVFLRPATTVFIRALPLLSHLFPQLPHLHKAAGLLVTVLEVVHFSGQRVDLARYSVFRRCDCMLSILQEGDLSGYQRLRIRHTTTVVITMCAI